MPKKVDSFTQKSYKTTSIKKGYIVQFLQNSSAGPLYGSSLIHSAFFTITRKWYLETI